MLAYILQSTICLLCFYALYHFILRKETFFRVNRYYLLVTMILGLSIPLIHQWISQSFMSVPFTASFETVSIGIQDISRSLENPSALSIHWTDILLLIYFIGVIFHFVRFAKGLLDIRMLHLKGEEIQLKGRKIILTKGLHLPFSFLDTMYLSGEHNFSQDELEKIVMHEGVHSRGWHSLDVIFFELVCIALWLSPAVYLYRKAIKDVHEFLADAAVLEGSHLQHYGHLLTSRTESGMQLALANNFFQSQLKNRFKMMTRKKSNNWAGLKYLAMVPVVLLTLSLFAFQQAAQSQKVEKEHSSADALVGKNAGFMLGDTIPPKEGVLRLTSPVAEDPVFVLDGVVFNHDGVNDLDPAEIASIDVVKKMTPELLEKYGEQANNGIVFIVTKNASSKKVTKTEPLNILDEIVVVGFGDTIPPESSILSLTKKVTEDPVIVLDGVVIKKGEGDHLDPEEIATVDVVKKITDEHLRLYGEQAQNGILFIVTKKGAKKSEKTKQKESPQDVFKVVEDMPRFPGCEDQGLDAEQLKLCSQKKMLTYIYSNIKYPAEARKAGIQGKSVVQFVVEKDGSISNIEVLRSLGGGIDEEVKRVAESMNQNGLKWTPGKQKGQKVRVQFALPVVFKLEGPTKEEIEKKKAAAGSVDQEIFKVVEEMPRFPGCENEGLTGDDLRKCAQKKMWEYVYSNLKYPEEAKAKNVEGRSIAQFTVEQDGSISDVKIVRSIGAGTDKAVTDALESMNEMDEKWIPGKQRGKDVRVMYTIPISFKLDSKAPKTTEKEKMILPKKTDAESLQLEDFRVSPNPNKGLFDISFKADAAPVKITLYNMFGEVVVSEEVDNFGGNLNQTFGQKGLAPGSYALSITQSGKAFTTMITVQE